MRVYRNCPARVVIKGPSCGEHNYLNILKPQQNILDTASPSCPRGILGENLKRPQKNENWWRKSQQSWDQWVTGTGLLCLECALNIPSVKSKLCHHLFSMQNSGEWAWPSLVGDCIMAGRAFVVAKEVFHHKNGNNLKLWQWLNDEKHFFLSKSNSLNKYLYLQKNFNHLRPKLFWPVQFSHQTCIGWANRARLWLLSTLKFRISWIFPFANYYHSQYIIHTVYQKTCSVCNKCCAAIGLWLKPSSSEKWKLCNHWIVTKPLSNERWKLCRYWLVITSHLQFGN